LPVQGQKVALVFSGGGAKGLAHIGVLKALEENNIPVDYIVGTSMGAIVGGYYAAGYSPGEIEEIVLSAEFQQWISGQLDDNYNYYYHSKEDNADVFNIDIGLDSGLNTSFKTNIASDISLNFAFAEHLSMAAYAAGYNFDSLYVPFRAIASEIFTQQVKVLESGSLSDALRASMTVPLVYRPIQIDGQYLFDGGIYNNFPVDIAKEEFDVDFIIGSNVSEKVFDEYPEDNDEKLIRQSLFFMLLDKSNPGLLDENGVYIEPRLEGYNAVDFRKAQAVIDSGYAAAMRQMPKICQQTIRQMPDEQRAARRVAFRSKFKDFEFTNLTLDGFNGSQKRYLSNFFNFKDKDKLSIHEIKKAYYQIVSEDFFKDVYPQIHNDSVNDGYTFHLYGEDARDVRLDFGGNISTRSVSQIYIGLGYKTYTGPLMDHYLNFYSGRFYQSLSASSRMYFPGSNYLYIQPELIFNKWDFINSRDVLFDASASTVLKQIDRKYGLTIGLPLGLKYKTELEAAYIDNSNFYSNNDNLNSSEVLDEFVFEGLKTGFEISSNTLNRKQFPTRGHNFAASLRYFDGHQIYIPGSTSRFSATHRNEKKWFTGSLDYTHYWRMNKHYTLGSNINVTASNQPFFANYFASVLMAPAYEPFPDSRTLMLQNFRAHQFVAGTLSNIFSIRKNLDLRLEVAGFLPMRSIEQVDQVPQFGPYHNDFNIA